MKVRTACQDRRAVKSLSQGHNEIARVGFESRLFWPREPRSKHLTTLPRTHLTTG